MKNKIVRLVGASVLAAVVVTGCGWTNSQNSMRSHSMHESKMMGAKEAATSAAD